MTRVPSASRNWWLSCSAWLAIGWFGAHLLGVVMTMHLEARLGFFPIWFLDCVACSAPEAGIPYGYPVVGGVSWPAVVAVLAALGLVVALKRKSADRLVPVLGIVVVAAMTAHVVVTWPVRYPGSLPPVFVAAAAPFLSAVVGSIGVFGAIGGPVAGLRLRGSGSVWPGASLVLGLAAMALLGGLVSLVAVGVSLRSLRSASPGPERVMVITGGVLALLSLILRVLLRLRYPNVFGWLW